MLTLAFLFINFTPIHGQRKFLAGIEEVQQEVIHELDSIFKSNDFTKKKGKKFDAVSGMMTVDIGVSQSGKVATFYKVYSDIKNIDFINFMSDCILNHRFNFKLQQQQRCKIRYTITF